MPQRSIHEKCFALFVGLLLPSHGSGEIKGSKAFSCAVLTRFRPDAVFLPAAVDQRTDFFAHLDLLRPRPRALVGALRRRVDAELSAEELVCRRMVKVVERALGDQHAPPRPAVA